MPGQNRNEAFVLKHRLTGAAILIGFAVVVLPLLLSGPGDGGDGQAQNGAADDSDSKVFHSSITPIGGATPARVSEPDTQADAGGEAESAPAAAGGQKPAEQAKVAQPRPAEPEEASGQTARPAESGETAAASGAGKQSADSGGEPNDAAAKPQRVERGWIVQVGTFRNPDNVRKLVAKLQGSGFESSTTEVDTSEGSATRVWVGPFETRVEAARTKTRVKQRTGSEGLIVAYP